MNARMILQQKGSEVFTIGRTRTVQEAVRALVAHGVGALVVMDEGDIQGIAGIVTERDVMHTCHHRKGELDRVSVEEVMTRHVITATPDDDVNDIQTLMVSRRIRHLPIVAGRRLVGLISIGDVVKVLQAATEEENRVLKDYIAGKYI